LKAQSGDVSVGNQSRILKPRRAPTPQAAPLARTHLAHDTPNGHRSNMISLPAI
jgi:hypothetical protein